MSAALGITPSDDDELFPIEAVDFQPSRDGSSRRAQRGHGMRRKRRQHLAKFVDWYCNATKFGVRQY
jgi:hypothetical protein